MERRAIIAIILTFLIIVLWGVVQSKFFPQPSSQSPKKEVKEEERPPTKVEKLDWKEEKVPPKKKVTVGKEVSVETIDYSAVLSSEDARLRHFKLKKFEDRVEESPLTISLTRFVKGLLGGKVEEPKKPMPLDLVNTSEEEGLPLGVTLLPFQSDGSWEVDKDKLHLMSRDERGEIIFSRDYENGLKVFKKFGFTSGKNTIDLEVEIQNKALNEAQLQVGVDWIGRVELEKLADEAKKDYGLRFSIFKNQKVEKREFGGAGASGCTPGCSAPKRRIEPFEFSEKGDIRWYCFEGEYFAALLIPPPTDRSVTVAVKGDERNLLKVRGILSPISIPPKQAIKVPYRIYLGPKEIGPLRDLGVGGEKLVDFGFFSIVAKPILWFLKLTNRVTGNYGIDIIIMSILIKIIFLPLTQISMKSMKEMQKVQPEMNRLRQTFKNDKVRLQQEMMLLYKRRKINPMSGCLPMLIQIPVFIALYNALQNAIEMRHAPFFWWIRDLSAKDPIYITPLIMGATMVLQQKMTPTSADPTQAKMFMLMPIMFTFLFLSFPSGLVLYWLVNNVLSIAHQYYMNKR
ncbi:MAG: membrane protein insertase YidC [Thermodesulfobacteriota bacterium]